MFEKSVDLVSQDPRIVSPRDLNDALERLAERSERQARIVELRVFGGLTVEQAADLLEISPATIKADWTIARAWLKSELTTGETS